MQDFCRGNEDGRNSTEIVLFILYGFLDAQKHGGEPLVQSGNSVIVLHLPAEHRGKAQKKSQGEVSRSVKYMKECLAGSFFTEVQ